MEPSLGSIGSPESRSERGLKSESYPVAKPDCDQACSVLPILIHYAMPDPENEKGEDFDIEVADEKSGNFVDELKRFKQLEEDLRSLEEQCNEIEAAKGKVINVFNDKRKNEIISSVEMKLSQCRKISKRLKAALTDKGGIKDVNVKLNKQEEEGSVKAEIRDNMFNYYMKKYYLAQKRFSELANAFKGKVRTRAKRDLQLISEGLTEEQAEDLIDRGMDQEYIQSQLNGDVEELGRLMAQADEVKQISQGVREILQMFQEMAALVDAQQETVDNVCHHVASAKEYTGEAVIELKTALAYQISARKKMLVCAIIIVIVLIVIILAILAAAGVFNKY